MEEKKDVVVESNDKIQPQIDKINQKIDTINEQKYKEEILKKDNRIKELNENIKKLTIENQNKEQTISQIEEEMELYTSNNGFIEWLKKQNILKETFKEYKEKLKKKGISYE